LPEPIFKIKIPEAITKYISKDAPKDARLMAAKGAIPMSPIIQATVCTFLLNDQEPEVTFEASKSLLNLPPNIIKNLAKDKLHPKTLDFYAKNKIDSPDLLELILINKLTPDETFLALADKIAGKPLDIICENQQRMLRKPEIANALKKNPNIPRSTIERIVSFLRMSGVQVEGESAVLTPDEVKAIIDETLKLREQAKKKVPKSPVAPPPPMPKGFDDEEEEGDDFYESEDEEFGGEESSFADDSFEVSDDLFEEKETVSEEEKKGIASQISTMTVPQKVKIALLGNKEVRSILIKDPNKIVSTAVIKSPKLTDNEIHNIAQMRSVNDEIIRYIAGNSDWTKNYSIKLALVGNPKTPLQISLKFLRFLNQKDMGDLARNKNVSPQLQKISKDLYNKTRGTA
jgi:hypothetical protein